MTEHSEAAKRHELQLLLLREGHSQKDAREAAATTTIEKVDRWLEFIRESAMRFPDRQIVPEGTVDITDVQAQREEARMEAEEDEYYEKRDRLAALMIESFNRYNVTTAVLVALLDALEANGIDRLEAMADIIKHVEFLQNMNK